MKGRLSLLFLAFAAVMLIFPAMALAQEAGDSTGTSAPAPTIQSDKDDYAPGDTVILTGSNWQPGESVNINVNDDEGQTWNRNVDVTADESGNVRDEFELPDWFVATYSVKATGSSGAIATTTFTDSVLPARGCAAGSPILVNTTADQFDPPGTGPSPTGCSLREAINAANGDPTADTISLPAGTYTLARTGAGEDNNQTGDLDIRQPLTIDGAGARTTIIQAGTNNSNGIDRVLHVLSSGNLTLSGATVRYGQINDDGGGIKTDRPLTLTDVAITENDATTSKSGGGISHQGQQLTINRATISGNTAANEGGGLHTTSGTATLTNVTITNNSAANGGGIRVNSDTKTLVNVTVSHNSASTGSNITRASGTINLRNTIVSTGSGGGNCSGTIGNTANNLDSGTSCGFGFTNGSKSSANANLGSLQDNGGPTDTRALGSGSAAIDAGTNNGAPNVDQRNVSRPQPQGGNHDIGAFELQTYQLSVAKAGAGSGTVTSNPAGITCGSDCSESYHAGTSVTLTATADSGSTFNGWSGGDGIKNDNGTYTVTMSAARSVTATFKANQTITFTSAAPSNAVIGDTYKPTATGGGSGNPVTFGASGACSYDSGTGLVTMDSAGSCTVTADQEGNANYNAASQASQAFSVGKRPTAISDVSGSGTYGGNATLTATLKSGTSALSGKSVEFKLNGVSKGTATTNASGVATLTGVSLAGINAGTHTNAVGASFAEEANYNGSSGSGNLTVAKADGSVTINNIPSNAVFGGSFTPDYTRAGDGVASTTSKTTNVCSVNSSGVVSFKAVGTCTLQASVTEGTNHLAATGAQQSFTIGQAPTTSNVRVSPNSQQYSDKVDLVATLSPASISGFAPATGVKFYIGTRLVGTAQLAANNGQLSATLSNVVLTEAPNPPNTPPYLVTAQFTDVNSNFNVNNATAPLTVTKENATTDYTGSLFVSTSGSSSSKATVNLAATIRDITAVDPATDPDGGDIRKATIEFVLSSMGGAVVAKCSPTIGLVSASDTKTGTATCSVPVDIGSADSIPYTVNMTIGGHYGAPANPTVVTVSKPLAGMITGGGFLVNESSAGLTAGATGQKSNFGFNVRPNKAGTGFLGNINTIVRNGGRVYQIKGNAMTSLVTKVGTATTPGTATFEGKASIQDVTNPLSPISIDGNATLRVTMADAGEPGSSDKIGITVWNKAGGLWFSSNWSGTRTIEQLLGGGNLVVR